MLASNDESHVCIFLSMKVFRVTGLVKMELSISVELGEMSKQLFLCRYVWIVSRYLKFKMITVSFNFLYP